MASLAAASTAICGITATLAVAPAVQANTEWTIRLAGVFETTRVVTYRQVTITPALPVEQPHELARLLIGQRL